MDSSARSRPDLQQDRLMRRRLQLQAEIHMAQAGGRPPAAAGEVADWKDDAQRLQLAEVADAEEQRDEDELARVEAALLRLRQGKYGSCLQCGQPIPWERLQVQPDAPRCAACQSEVEHRRPTLRSA